MIERPIVFKFGGTSVGSPSAIRHAIARVRESSPNLVVVVSAASGVTDELLAAARNAAGDRLDLAIAAAREFEARHSELIIALLANAAAIETLQITLRESTRELIAICESIHILRELTTRTLDAVSARGERMLAAIFAAALEEQGIPSTLIDSTEIIFTERKHGNVWPRFDACRDAAKQLILPPLERGVVTVLPGFIGKGSDGEVVTLGRGGSDFSAAIIARAVKARGLVLWKEVDGLLTSDPRLVASARVIPQLHYREAAELAYYGAKVLHPRTMVPLLEAAIPLTIRNTFKEGQPGTLVAAEPATDDFPVKALTSVAKQALISVEGSGMLGVPGIAARTFIALSDHGHSVSMISQASSEASICFVLPAAESHDAVTSLQEAFRFELEARLIERVSVVQDIALIAVVGLGMRGTPGIAARVFSALSSVHVNVVSIAQGSSELNITIAIRDADVSAALNALHAEFQLDKIRPLRTRNRHDSSVTVLGFGQIGRALAGQLIKQESYFREDLGIRIQSIALADRSGLLVNERGFSSEELSSLIVRKESGNRLTEGSASGAMSVEDLGRHIREQIHDLPSSRSIVVDVTADETAPLLLEALERRCHVVVANKKPLAVAQSIFDRMMQVARENRVAFRYEATVGAGLPILDSLAKLKDAGDEVLSILGCLSGTIGYLMTQLEDGVAYSAAVRSAYQLGYTEPDPRDDLSGVDVARKALILARTLGRKLELSEISIESLFPEELGDADPERFLVNLEKFDSEMARRVKNANAQGNVLRYVARLDADRISVGLEALPNAHPMGRLRGTDNQVVLRTNRYQVNPLIVTGPGAGADVTASGVLNDIVSITRS